MEQRYFLDQDQDGHWYLVQESKRKQWNKWTDLDPDTPAAWKTPKYATPVGSHPNSITFTDPKEK